MSTVKGHCDPAFKRLADLLAENVASGEELGASICVNVDGKNVVDIWDGYVDEARRKEWKEDTIVNVWSNTKSVSNLAVLMAADRGLLDVNDKVAKHWPEFAENGKENVEIRHILSHTSGVCAWDKPITIEQALDTPFSTAALAQQPPMWEPGTKSGYHSATQGILDGEIIRRSTGKRLKDFIASEIAGPLGADFQLGAREEDWPRVSTMIPPPPFPEELFKDLDMNSPMAKTFLNPMIPADYVLQPLWRQGEMGAVNGHANARALNRILSVISLGGEVDGIRLLSPKTLDLIFKQQILGRDLVLPHDVRFGIGYGLPLAEMNPEVPNKDRVCFWGGWGGSICVMDGESRTTFTYVMNKMGEGTVGNPRTNAYIRAAFEAVEKTKGGAKP